MYRKQAKLTLAIIFLITVACVYSASQLRLDYNFQNFFPIGDPNLEYYEQYREWFENDNDYLLVGLRRQEGVFDEQFLAKVDSLTRYASSLDEVVEVSSPTNIRRTVVGPMGPIAVPYLHWDDPSRYAQDSIQIFESPTLVGSFFSADGQSIAIIIKHSQFLPKEKGEVLLNELEPVVAALDFEEAHIAGKSRAQVVYIGKMQNELIGFLGASFLLVTIFLALTYRSLFGILLPLLVVALGVVGILGVMGAAGKDLDLMMILLPTIMFVVGMSDVVHIMTKYIEELRHGATKVEAIKVTFKEVGLATFLTSLTTSVGFFTLYFANIAPIKEFGLYTAIGVFMAFLMAFTVLPSMLILLRTPKVAYREKNKEWWNKLLRTLFIRVLRARHIIVVLSGIVLVVSLAGLTQIEVNSLLLEDITGRDPLKLDFEYFDETFGGTRPFEMSVTVTDSGMTVYDLAVLREMEKVNDYLRNEYGAQNLLSPVLLVKTLYQAQNGGIQANFRLPDSEQELQRTLRYLNRITRNSATTPLNTPDLKVARITGKMGDIGSKITLEKNDSLMAWAKENITLPGVELRITGTSLLIDKNNEYLANNMMQGLAIAFAVISLIVGAMFKSVRMVLITLIPNMIPLLMVAAIMGFMDITLKLSTSIIFTIAFGIAVDDTIHFISKLRIEVDKEKSLIYALKRTFLHTGKAIIITSIILAGGFLTLIFSTFGGTYYIGLLVGLTLIFALVVELTLLPVLVLWFFKRRKTLLKRNRK